MKIAVLTTYALVGTVLASSAAPTLKDWRSQLPTVSGDVAIVKERAERGDVGAQVQLANSLAANQMMAEAAKWYRKAAEQGSLEAQFQLGDILINGARCSNPNQRVAPNPMEGVRWTFAAATNFHVGACRNMAFALESGSGVSTNMVEAYAWMELFARSNAVSARPIMDRMALRMSLQETRQSHILAERFMNRQWPHYVAHKPPEVDLPLKLTGVTIGPVLLAIINGQTFGEGDSGTFPVKGKSVRVNCLKITRGSVLEAVEGEGDPRELRLK